MNYRHIYHAGNICDVVKHASLAMLIGRLREKETGFVVIDTHAGIGRYDLGDERAAKTGEAEAGILKLLATPPIPEISDYYKVLRDINPDGNWRHYAGSALLARRLMRPQDRLIACELHPEDVMELRRVFRDDPQVNIHHRDGYEALKALAPPPEKRGLIFIDPPFEDGGEFSRLVETVSFLGKRWTQGQIAIWYPIKERPAIWRFHEDLSALGIPKILCAEFIYNEETRSDRLNGSGLIFINPPWKFDEQLTKLFPALHKALGTESPGGGVKWLVGG
jgi:23S rRNA (adenine2030-N6)-methyltransferase